MDSLGFAEFLVELEDQFDIVISPSEVERADINTPEKILALVESRI
jgi:D-alanine--poly(phosphoribitol) ligase subunit 2